MCAGPVINLTCTPCRMCRRPLEFISKSKLNGRTDLIGCEYCNTTYEPDPKGPTVLISSGAHYKMLPANKFSEHSPRS